MAEHSTVNRRVTGSSPVGGANIARAPERSSGALAIYVPLARTSNPSGLRPRRGKDFWFLARSENLRLASSSPVGTFPLSREPVTTPPYAGAGAPAPGPRAYTLGGITVFTSSRARKNRHPAVSSPVGTFSSSHESVTPRAYALGEAKILHPAKMYPAKM